MRDIKIKSFLFVGSYGHIATFSAHASGTGNTYQWQYTKNGGISWWNSTAD